MAVDYCSYSLEELLPSYYNKMRHFTLHINLHLWPQLCNSVIVMKKDLALILNLAILGRWIKLIRAA
jgi:hypothetical protein